MSADFPVVLDLEGRDCLVVGAGRIAARKIAGLLAAGATVRVVAPDIGEEVSALADRVGVTRRPFEPADVDGAWLVVAATADAAVDAEVFAAGQAARVWVNAADHPAACSVTLPAVGRRGPVTVAVSTAGQSPALAVWLRDRIVADLGPEYEVLVDLLAAERRARHAEGQGTEALDWQGALDSDMLDLIRSGRVDRARERLQACLSSS
ncbi:MAG TPA: bifunctional precorrin-2 dehydrogenase/sirohydrochlorin ferrochelatase [Acidimicrobiales bacterium]|nr:bifunctional precorrin-2 dehydrogenase/sirohydrochlorin ferrochelatase [Acidimicrobiales bacterium]